MVMNEINNMSFLTADSKSKMSKVRSAVTGRTHTTLSSNPIQLVKKDAMSNTFLIVCPVKPRFVDFLSENKLIHPLQKTKNMIFF